MKVCIVHNEYGRLSGEEIVVKNIISLLTDKGHEVCTFIRRSSDISESISGKIKAFFSGIYSFNSRRLIKEILMKYNPDIIHIHNVFPLISPSILVELRKAQIPVIMSVHNYRLICPNGLLLTNGEICERCLGGREYWCIFKNCEGDIFKSIGYAVRNYVARRMKLFRDNVALFAVLSKLQRDKLIKEGYQDEKIRILPNMTEFVNDDGNYFHGNYVGYAGRLSKEKGIEILLRAAKRCKKIPFRIAGELDVDISASIHDNVVFLGFLDHAHIGTFYRESRIIVIPSIWYEPFGLVVIEAMLYGKPVICSNIGAFPDIVDDGITGLLVSPGDSNDLEEKINYLWNNPEVCRKMGELARKRAMNYYSREKYYERLLDIYNEVKTIQ